MLRWQSDAPKYSSWNTYIWQPFRYAPPFVWVRIIIIDKLDFHNPRLLLLHQTCDCLERFRSKVKALQDCDRTLIPWTPMTAMFETLYAVFGVLVSDMIMFLSEASEQISRIVRSFIMSGGWSPKAKHFTTPGSRKQGASSIGEYAVLDSSR